MTERVQAFRNAKEAVYNNSSLYDESGSFIGTDDYFAQAWDIQRNFTNEDYEYFKQNPSLIPQLNRRIVDEFNPDLGNELMNIHSGTSGINYGKTNYNPIDKYATNEERRKDPRFGSKKPLSKTHPIVSTTSTKDKFKMLQSIVADLKNDLKFEKDAATELGAKAWVAKANAKSKYPNKYELDDTQDINNDGIPEYIITAQDYRNGEPVGNRYPYMVNGWRFTRGNPAKRLYREQLQNDLGFPGRARQLKRKQYEIDNKAPYPGYDQWYRESLYPTKEIDPNNPFERVYDETRMKYGDNVYDSLEKRRKRKLTRSAREVFSTAVKDVIDDTFERGSTAKKDFIKSLDQFGGYMATVSRLYSELVTDPVLSNYDGTPEEIKKSVEYKQETRDIVAKYFKNKALLADDMTRLLGVNFTARDK